MTSWNGHDEALSTRTKTNRCRSPDPLFLSLCLSLSGVVSRVPVFARPSRNFPKPLSVVLQRVFAWDDRDQMSEVPWANLSSLKCLAMAEGTILLRSVPAKPVMFWLSNTCTQLPVEDYPIPARVASARPNRSPGWEWVPDEDSLAEAGEDGAAEGRDQASRKRKESPSPAVAAAGSGGAEQRQRQEEEGASQQAAKRRASRRPGAGVRVSPVGSGGPLGEAGGPGAEGRTAQVI